MTAVSIIPKAHSSQDDFPVIPYYPQFIPYRQFNNFIMIPLSMIGQQGLPATAVTMYGYLLKYSGKDGLCYPSQQTLAKDLDLSTRQVRNLVNILDLAQAVQVGGPDGQASGQAEIDFLPPGNLLPVLPLY